jgi:DNA-binding NarL/FixJ family response regulator
LDPDVPASAGHLEVCLTLEKCVPLKRSPEPIRIGVLAGEPIRLEGLTMIFEQAPPPDLPQLVPVFGTLEQLLSNPAVEYLVIDLNSSSGGLPTLDVVRRSRPGMRQIVIGPEHDDEKVLDAIIAGARAYLDSSASPETVRMAIDVVVGGSIWAPRRLLSKLIDRLLGVPDSHIGSPALQLTVRERQVLDLILQARSNREIAKQLGIEERTVKAHVGRLMRKTGADNRIELSMRALNQSIVPEGQSPSQSPSGTK